MHYLRRQRPGGDTVNCINCGQPHNHWDRVSGQLFCQECLEESEISADLGDHCLAALYRTLTYAIPCILIVAGVATWVLSLHHPSPCAAVPEVCRPAGGKVR